MKRNLIPIYVALFLIGATALWYFGHHRPAQKILAAEPKKVYKSTTPLQPNGLSVEPVPSDTIQEPRDGNAEIRMEGADTKTEDTDNAAMPEKLDNNWNQGEDTNSDKLVLQEDLSVDDPAAAEAFEKYIAVESEYQAALEIFKEALISQNSEQLKSATDLLKEVMQRRKEALENLAPYSEDAAKLLEEMKENEKRAEDMTAEYKAEIRELKDKMREMDNILEKARSE